jgi:hypothetical protein
MTALGHIRVRLANLLLDIAEAVAPEKVKIERDRLRAWRS